MEKKYQDTIVELIKTHKRFEGLEENLDDIVSDVYRLANTTLSAIDDEEVLKNYLNKIITTAIITTAQKLNINKRKNSRNIEDILSFPSIATNIRETTTVEVIDTLDIANEQEAIVDNMLDIESEDIINFVDTEQSEDVEFENETDEQSEELKLEDEVDEHFNETTFVNNSTEEVVVDKLLVEKMINGVQENDLEENLLDDRTNSLEEDLKSDNTYEDLEELTVIEDLDSFADSPEYIEDMLEEATDIEVLENYIKTEIVSTEEVNNVKEKEVVAEEVEEVNVVNEFEEAEEINVIEEADDNNLTIVSEDIEDLNIIDESESFSEFVELENEEILSSSIENDDAMEELISNEDLAEDTIEIIEEQIENNDTEISSSYIAPDNFQDRFNCFYFEPNIIDFDSEYICKNLIELDKNYSDLSIIKICELKFYQNKSIKDISNDLNMPEDIILEALEKIIDTIKD